MNNQDDVLISKAFEEKVKVYNAKIEYSADRFYVYETEHEYTEYEHGEDANDEYTYYNASHGAYFIGEGEFEIEGKEVEIALVLIDYLERFLNDQEDQKYHRKSGLQKEILENLQDLTESLNRYSKHIE